jgi:O-ureido-D-serine cyclo-ligase
MARVALVTATATSGADPDEVPLLDALIWQGVDASVVAWDDRSVDWGSFDLAVVRSTWDYAPRAREFGRWLRRVERRTRLMNPAAAIEWNIDKHYLAELAAAGLPVVPTTILEPGDVVRVPDRGEIVVKPAVSAGARDTVRYRLPEQHDATRAHVDELLAASRAVLVQPYLSSVEEPGEVDLVYLGGRFSHAVRKASALPVPGEPAVVRPHAERVEAVEATDAQRALGDAVVRALTARWPLLYARIDLVTGLRDELLVLEAEIAEPALALTTAEGAADRFAEAIATTLADQRSGE